MRILHVHRCPVRQMWPAQPESSAQKQPALHLAAMQPSESQNLALPAHHCHLWMASQWTTLGGPRWRPASQSIALLLRRVPLALCSPALPSLAHLPAYAPAPREHLRSSSQTLLFQRVPCPHTWCAGPQVAVQPPTPPAPCHPETQTALMRRGRRPRHPVLRTSVSPLYQLHADVRLPRQQPLQLTWAGLPQEPPTARSLSTRQWRPTGPLRSMAESRFQRET